MKCLFSGPNDMFIAVLWSTNVTMFNSGKFRNNNGHLKFNRLLDNLVV